MSEATAQQFNCYTTNKTISTIHGLPSNRSTCHTYGACYHTARQSHNSTQPNISGIDPTSVCGTVGDVCEIRCKNKVYLVETANGQKLENTYNSSTNYQEFNFDPLRTVKIRLRPAKRPLRVLLLSSYPPFSDCFFNNYYGMADNFV